MGSCLPSGRGNVNVNNNNKGDHNIFTPTVTSTPQVNGDAKKGNTYVAAGRDAQANKNNP
jgi:hypothetical protein